MDKNSMAHKICDVMLHIEQPTRVNVHSCHLRLIPFQLVLQHRQLLRRLVVLTGSGLLRAQSSGGFVDFFLKCGDDGGVEFHVCPRIAQAAPKMKPASNAMMTAVIMMVMVCQLMSLMSATTARNCSRAPTDPA